MVYLARSLVRNLKTTTSELSFRDFRIYRPQTWGDIRGFEATSSLGQEYLYERCYATLPPLAEGEVYGSIPSDFEETVLLLRLYRAGDIAFSPLAILEPDGSLFWQELYAVTYPLRSLTKFGFEQPDCKSWDEFADQLRGELSWHSAWFSIARRFFLQGSSKKLNPGFDEVDRVVDFAIALEATLVPEKDFSGRRMRERAAALNGQNTAADMRRRAAKMLYDLRSTIVHGSALSAAQKAKLESAAPEIENVVRDVLVGALRFLPPDEHERAAVCRGLWDISNEDRVAYLCELVNGLSVDAKELLRTRLATRF